MRMGKRKQPTYRVVAADKRKARNGRFIEVIGFYDPRRDPSVIEIENEKAVRWLSEGAQPSERVEKLLKISGAWDEFKGLSPGTSVTAPPVTPSKPTPLAAAVDDAEVPVGEAVGDEPPEAAVDEAEVSVGEAVGDEPPEAAVDEAEVPVEEAVGDEPPEAAVDEAEDNEEAS